MDANEECRKVIGTFCVFLPEKLDLAVNDVCSGLCNGAQLGFEEAKNYLSEEIIFSFIKLL